MGYEKATSITLNPAQANALAALRDTLGAPSLARAADAAVSLAARDAAVGGVGERAVREAEIRRDYAELEARER